MKLGELFVDLGVNSGGAFNTLSSFAFKFENLANLSERITGAIDDLFGEAPKWAKDIKNMSSDLALSVSQFQKLEASAIKTGTPLSQAAGFMKSLWGEFYANLSDGFQNEEYQKKWTKFFGAPALEELRENINTPIQLLRLLMENMNTIASQEDLAGIQQAFGLDTGLINTFNEFLYGANNVTTLTREQVDNLESLREAMAQYELESDRLYNQWLGSMAPMFEAWITKILNLKKAYYEATEASQSFMDLGKNTLDFISKLLSDNSYIDKFFITIHDALSQLGDFYDYTIGAPARGFESKKVPVVRATKRNNRTQPNNILEDESFELEENPEGLYDDEIVPAGAAVYNRMTSLEKALQGATIGNIAPSYVTTIYTEPNNVGNVAKQIMSASIENTKSLMLSRGFVYNG